VVMSLATNERPRVDAGWRVVFAFQGPWPRATQAARYAPQYRGHAVIGNR
jgi:hypothetical protein